MGASLRVGANTSEFQEQMKQMLSAMKLVTSEYQLQAAQAKATGNASDILKAQQAELTAKIKIQSDMIKSHTSNLSAQKNKLTELKTAEGNLKAKVAELSKAYEESTKATGKNSEESKTLKKQLDEAKEAHARTTQAIEKQEQAIEKSTIKLNNAKTTYTEYQTNLNETENKLNQCQKTWTVFGNEIKNVSQEAGEAGNNFITLGDIIKANVVSDVILSGVRSLADGIKEVSLKALNVGMDFESGMSQVAATMGITADEIENGSEAYEILEKSAKDCGATTKYSATQAAEALNYLALAGYDAEKSAQVLPKVLNLASAGGMDLAYASDMVTDSMAALGIETENLDNYIDQMAKTSQKSNTSVSQLGEAILTVGGTAKVLSGQTVELNSCLGILADNGIKGAEGGTALRNIILSLTAPTDKAAESIEALGLEVLDANGNLRPMNDIFNDLNEVLGSMADGEKTQVLNEIFNKTDLKSVNALLSNSGERFNELTSYLNDCEGAAASMADTMENNLQGKITILQSALEGAGIAAYEKFKGPLTNAIDSVTQNVDVLSASLTSGTISEALEVIAGGFANLIEVTADVATTALPVAIEGLQWVMDNGGTIKSVLLGIGTGFAVFKTATIINTVTQAMQGFRVATAAATVVQKLMNVTMAANPIVLVVTLLATLVSALAGFVMSNEEARNAVLGAWDALKGGIGNTVSTISTFLTQTLPNALSKAKNFAKDNIAGLLLLLVNPLAGATKLLYDNCDGFKNIVDDAAQFIYGKGESVVEWIKNVPDNVASFFSDLPYKIGYAIGNGIGSFIKFGMDVREWAQTEIPSIIENICQYLLSLPGKMWTSLIGAVQIIILWGYSLKETAKEQALGIVNQVLLYMSQLPSNIYNAIISTVTKIILWGVKLKQKGKEAALSLRDSIIEVASKIPSEMMEIGTNIVQGVWNGIQNAKEWFMEQVTQFFTGIVDGVKSALGIHSPSTVFRDEVGKFMAEGTVVGFVKEFAKASNEINAEVRKLPVNLQADITPMQLIRQENTIDSVSNIRTGNLERYTTNNNIIYITNYTTLDGKVIAKETKKEVVKQITQEQKMKERNRGA